MAPIATTTYGQLEGTEEAAGVLRFAGVPFAKPPVGELRFRPPQKPDKWDGVRPATSFADTSLQGPSMIEALFGTQPEPSAEDCLYLNVYTSALDDAKRPVMVWIHGGGFMMGSGSSPMYDGGSFVRRGDVVFVSMNYRLAELGFAELSQLDERYAGSGNNGILDQVAALEWVHENIVRFGGDPDNVTIFGESAGGMSVGTLLATPSAKGLFHKAIPQSGAAHNVLESKVAAEVTDELMRRLGITSLSELVNAEPDQLVQTRNEIILHNMSSVDSVLSTDAASLGLPWQPVYDEKVLPEKPIEAVRAGAAAGIPLLIGTTRDEWKLFGMMMDISALTQEKLVERANHIVGDGRRFVEAYEASEPGRPVTDLFGEMATDFIFRIPAIRLAEAQIENRSPVWMYQFSWESRAFGGQLGACHAMELPFVFHNVDDPRMALFLGEGPTPTELADQIQDAWIAFARSGDPNHPGLPDWPAYDTSRRPVMELAEPCRLLQDPKGVERELWSTIL